MFQVVFGLIGATVGSIAAAVAYLFWPMPALEFDWESQLEVLSEREDCHGVASLLGAFVITDPEGTDRMIDEVIPNGPCAILSEQIATLGDDDIFIGARGFADRNTLFDPVAGRDRLEGAVTAWRLMRRFRREAGLGFAGWTDAITYFRCDRYFGTLYATMWLFSRDMLAQVHPEYVAPFDARHAACTAHVVREYERLSAIAEDAEVVHPSLQYLLDDYESMSEKLTQL